MVVILLDAFRSDMFQDILHGDDALREAFAGFTSHTDVVAPASTTYLSLPAIHSGAPYPIGSSISLYYDQAVERESFMVALARSGHRTLLLNPISGALPRGDILVRPSARFVDGRTAAYLRDFVFSSGSGCAGACRRSVAEFLFGSWEFDFDIHDLIRNSPLMLELLAKQLTVDDGPPRSEIPAPAGDARPYAAYRELQSRVRHDCMGSTVHARSGRMRNGAYGRGSLRAMKRHDVYENSAVFVISDHGGGFSREELGASGNDPAFQRALGIANAVLANKPPHARGGMAFSDRPMTLTEIPALVCSLADCRVESAFPPQDSDSRRFLSYD